MGVCAALAKAVRNARRNAITVNAQSPLNQLLLALHNYHDVHGRFPPAYLADVDGTPMHSWRVLILPYIEQRSLYDAYDFAEPWNGPNNSKLINRMPPIYGSPSEDESPTFTNMVAVTGAGTAFPNGASTCLADFVDGPENTILLTEIVNSRVPWLQPRDINIHQGIYVVDDPAALRISAVPWRRPYVVFADHIRAYAVLPDIPAEAIKALATIAGGEPVTRSELISQGYLH